MPTAKPRSAGLVSLLGRYPDPVQELIRSAREILLTAWPGAEESVDARAGIIAYGYGPGYKGMVGTLILSKKGLKIGLVRGRELPDPMDLMSGAGKVHRHIPITTKADLRRPGLRSLLKAALAAWKRRSANR